MSRVLVVKQDLFGAGRTNHLEHIYPKLGVENRTAAASFASDRGSASNPYERLDLVFIDDETFRKARNFRSLLGHHCVPSVQEPAQSCRSHSAFCHSGKGSTLFYNCEYYS